MGIKYKDNNEYLTMQVGAAYNLGHTFGQEMIKQGINVGYLDEKGSLHLNEEIVDNTVKDMVMSNEQKESFKEGFSDAVELALIEQELGEGQTTSVGGQGTAPGGQGAQIGDGEGK